MKLEFKKIGNLHKRWLTNITLVIVAVGVVCVAAITASYAAYCYKNMDADLQNRARTTTDYFKEAIGQDYDTFYQSCITYAETFDQADALELQFIDQYGKIVASSYGTWAATSPRTPEVQEAISTRTIQPFVGKDPDTGERIMAVSSPMIYSNGQVIGVLRSVTPTAIMDREIVSIAFISITVLVAALVIILLFSSFFIRSVMLPVEQITEKAKRIANGSYGAQIKTKYNDEIADLAETINEMSVKISQNEKMQAEFISQLSHELRTPLTVINGWSETLLVIMVISILIFSIASSLLLTLFPGLNALRGSFGYRLLMIAFKLLLLPLVVGITYEINRWAGRHDNGFTRVLTAPGMLLQHFTTNEPDDSMIEVGITAVQAVLPREAGADRW